MDHEWIVQVTDPAGAPVTTAKKVAFALFDAHWDWPYEGATPAATHAHSGGGVYNETSPISPSAGVWVLVVLVDGKSPVTQYVILTSRASGEFVATPVGFSSTSPITAATMKMTSEVKTVGGSKVRRTTFRVTVFPEAELVVLSGEDFESTRTQFRIFAENWVKGMRDEKKIDNGTIITLFSCDERDRERLVPAVGGRLMQVDGIAFGSTAGITPGVDHRPVVGEDVSIVNLYQYLDGVGKARPGIVKEVGLFTHSFPGGPLLFDTFDRTAGPTRDPNDFDGRVKDFNSTNMALWPDMKKAMAPGGKWHIWGCSATTEFKDAMAAAFDHKKDGDLFFFEVESTLTTNDHKTIIEIVRTRTNRRAVRAMIDAQFRSNPYLANAATTLGIPMFGAPPGLGSNFRKDGFGRDNMFINGSDFPRQIGFFKDEFSPEFDPTSDAIDTGYVDYAKLKGHAPAPAAAFAPEFFRFDRRFDPSGTPPAPTTTIAFANGKHFTMSGVKVTLKATPKPGFATPGVTGVLYELDDTSDATKSLAFFVQEDKKTFRVDRDSAGNFTVLGPEV